MTIAPGMKEVGRAFWRRELGVARYLGEDFFLGLIDKFLDGVTIVDPESFDAVADRPVLFLANHQVFLESLLFCTAVAPLHGRPVVGLAKSQHRERWLGRFGDLVWAHPGMADRHYIEYIDRDQPDLHDLVRRLERRADRGASFLVHVEGTRRRSARRGRVQAMSPFWTDLAVEKGWAVVPVRFIGGLPVADPGHKQEVPVGYGRQAIRLGPALVPGALAGLASDARMARVRAAINGLHDNTTEVPSAPDPAFGAAVAAWVARTGGDAPTTAILQAFLARVRTRRPEIETLAVHGARSFADPIDAFAAACHVAERGDRVALELTDDPEGRWLARLGRFLVGPGGPEIRCVRAATHTIRTEDEARAEKLCG